MSLLKSLCSSIIGPLAFLVIFQINLRAQTRVANSLSEIEKLYVLSEQKYPLNDEFMNGCIYPLPNFRILGDPYFNGNEWISATLFINGKAYPEISLKYDIIIDELIIKSKQEDKLERLIAINKSQVDSFQIDSHFFVNSKNLFPGEKENTYYQRVYKGKYSAYKKYQKSFIDMYSNSAPAGKFSSQKSSTFLFNGETLTGIRNTKSFLDCFEKTSHAELKRFIKSNDISFKNISDSELAELMKFSISLISN